MLQGRTGYLRRIDNARLHQVFELAAGGVEAEIVFAVRANFLDDDGAGSMEEKKRQGYF